MKRLGTAVVAGLALAFGAAVSAEPRLLFVAGDVERDAESGRTIVRSGLVQQEVAPGVVISAASGADYRLQQGPSEAELTVMQGEVRVLARDAGVLYRLGEGRYRVRPQASALLVEQVDRSSREPEMLTKRVALPLADVVWLRQEEVLRIDARDLARGVLSLFRPRGR